MRSKRKAKRVLKIYAKEIINQRASYADTFTDDYVVAVPKTQYSGIFKRAMLVVLILILTFALLVVGASAVGIKIFNFDLFETSTHTELINRNDEASENVYYEPTYIPKEYSLDTIDEIEGSELNYIYENKQGQILIVTESYNNDLTTTIDNENCKRSTEIIGENEVKIYNYDGGNSIYLLQKGNTFIMLDGSLGKTEFKKIILGLIIKK